MLVQLTKADGKRVAVDHYRVDLIEQLGDTECVIHTSFADEPFKRVMVAHSFDEVMKRFRDAQRREFEDPKEPWQEDEDDEWGY